MIDDETAGKLIALTIGGVWWASGPIGKWWEKQRPAKKADAVAAAAIDIGKVLLDHDKAHLEELDNIKDEHKEELDQYEARELNLTAANTELLRQSAETGRLHLLAMQQLTADRDADRIHLQQLRSVVSDMREDVEEGKRLHEACELRLLQMQASYENKFRESGDALRAAQNGRAAEVADLRDQLETKNRRGYRTAKIAEEASGDHGPFTATDVWPEGKPRL